MRAQVERKPEPPINTPDIDTKVIRIESIEDDKSKGIKTLKTWREVPPRHYTLKIESFSSLVRILKKTKLDNYESMEFEASGYRWKLILYPRVEEGINESDHISLRLKITSFTGWMINAILIFFLYDQLRGKYLSIQDMEVSQFTQERKASGDYQLVCLSCFKDVLNGYLVNDSCMFGVEVFVLKNQGESACFRTLTEQRNNVIVWNVEKLSELKETGHFSQPFTVGDYTWKLHLYNRGIPKVKGKYLSIFLCLQEHDKFASGWKMHVEFKLAINGEANENKKIAKKGNAWFSALDDAWGFPRFIKLVDLKRLVRRDAIQIDVQIISMSMPEIKMGDYYYYYRPEGFSSSTNI